MVDFDLLIEIPLDTDPFIAFIIRCMHSLPRAVLLGCKWYSQDHELFRAGFKVCKKRRE
jgi:hypothetical protein